MLFLLEKSTEKVLFLCLASLQECVYISWKGYDCVEDITTKKGVLMYEQEIFRNEKNPQGEQ